MAIRFAQSQESATLPAALAVGRLAAVILSTQGDVYKRQPREGSEREPETLCLQAEEARARRDFVLFVERTGELRYVARLRS